jgi:hypothetical protein
MNEIRNRQDDEEAIIEYLVSEDGNVTLTQRQLDRLSRMDFADNLLRAKFTRTDDVARAMQKKFKGLSKSQARRDILSAQFVFGCYLSSNKKYSILIAADMILKGFNRALKVNDAYAMISAGKEYGKLFGGGKEEEEIPKFNTQPEVYIIELATAEAMGLPVMENLEQKILEFKKKKELHINTSFIPEAELIKDGTD